MYMLVQPGLGQENRENLIKKNHVIWWFFFCIAKVINLRLYQMIPVNSLIQKSPADHHGRGFLIINIPFCNAVNG